MNTIGRIEVSFDGPNLAAAEPPRISAAAPPAGSRAMNPGKANAALSTAKGVKAQFYRNYKLVTAKRGLLRQIGRAADCARAFPGQCRRNLNRARSSRSAPGVAARRPVRATLPA